MSGRPERASYRALLTAIAIATLWSCDDATTIQILEVDASGFVFGSAFVDRDGNGALTAQDTVVVGAEVRLLSAIGGGTVSVGTTDSLGLFQLADVPAGSYRLDVDSTTLGDSLFVVGPASSFVISAGDSSQYDVGLTYETLTLEEALATPPGRRIFTHGIALNTRVNFGDGQVHFAGDSLFLRALQVERGGLTPGDSVRLLGRLVIDNGRPALQNVTQTILVPNAQPVVPVEVATGTAAHADSAALDAALATIRRAEITDTSTNADGDFRFWADDGTDSVEFVVRDFLVQSFNTSAFRPDTIVRIAQANGLLSPYDDGTGNIRWRFLPRGAGDVALEIKTADIEMSATFDTAAASMGDTVSVEVVARNRGPHAATGVEVSDSIPTGTSFLSASTTSGAYDEAEGLWTIGRMVAGAADTLSIRLEVTTAGPVTVTNVARFLGLVFEVDPAGGNNTASDDVVIS